MDWQDRLRDIGSDAISAALASSLETLTGPIIGQRPPDSNPTAAQVNNGVRAQPQAATIEQRQGTEGTKNGLVQFFSDASGGNSGVMIAIGAVVLAVVAAMFMRKR